MKNKAIMITLAAAGTLAVLAGLTAAVWVSGDQPGANISSYVDKTPENPKDLYQDRVASDPSKPQPAGQYAKQNQNADVTGCVEDGAIRPFAGMTDQQVEQKLEQVKIDDPEAADFLMPYWKVYKVMHAYRPGMFERDHILCDENKNDVAEAAVELYNSGELSAADQETIGLFVYDQINCLAGASSPYTAAARQIVEEVCRQPGFVQDETPAS